MKNIIFGLILMVIAFALGYLSFLNKEGKNNQNVEENPALVMGSYDPASTEFNPVPGQRYFGGRCYNASKNEVPC